MVTMYNVQKNNNIMKFKNIMSAMLLAGVFAVTSCSQEEIETTVPQADSKVALNITVSDTGVQGDAATRATENGYATTFTAGDAIGVYGVKDNSVVGGINNKKFTLQDDGTWKITGDVIEYTEAEMGDIKFFAYYPYCETDDDRLGGAEFDATSPTPFADIVSRWTIDYAEAASYTSNDLMISKSTSVEANGAVGELNFKMNHCMAVAAVKLAGKTYKFDNTPAIADYVVSANPIDFKIAQGGGEKEVKNAYYDEKNGLYRILVKPNTGYTLSGSYALGGTMEYTKTHSGSDGGKVVKFEVASTAAAINHTLQVGDYYCADGSIVGKNEAVPANAIGVVFFVGNPQPSANGICGEALDILYNDRPNCVHGLVVALKNSSDSKSKFGDSKSVYYGEWLATDAWSAKLLENGVGKVLELKGYRGYNNTKIMNIATDEGKIGIEYDNKLAQTGNMVPAAPACQDALNSLKAFSSANSAPAVSSGWFVPSVTEFSTLGENLSDVNSSLNSASGTEIVNAEDTWYWSSTERIGNPAYEWAYINGTCNALGNRNSGRGEYIGYFRFTLAF